MGFDRFLKEFKELNELSQIYYFTGTLKSEQAMNKIYDKKLFILQNKQQENFLMFSEFQT